MRYLTGLLLLFFTLRAGAQPIPPIHIQSPQPNEEVCLGSGSVPITVTVSNGDSIARTLVAHVEIQNVVTKIAVYSQSDTLRNILSSGTQTITFPDYAPKLNILSELGTLVVSATVVAIDPSGQEIPGWPFRGSVTQRLFGIRRMATPLFDPSDNYSTTIQGNIPDQTIWASKGATVVEGDSQTWDPPEPRDPVTGFGASSIHSPVIQLDRTDVQGNFYGGNGAGDTLTTFPINVQGQTRMVLTFDFLRGGKHPYPGLFDVQTLLGPEATVVDANGRTVRQGDSLILEFKHPGESECNPNAWDEIAAIDGGHDLEFQSFWMNLTQTSATYRINGHDERARSLTQNYLDSNFRFRLRLKANSGLGATDDGDAWYVDNILLEVPRFPNIQTLWARVVTPYTKIPYSTASALPVYARFRNSEDTGPFGQIAVYIINRFGDTVYRSTKSLDIETGIDTIVRFSDWNARNQIGNGPFTVIGWTDPNYAITPVGDNETYTTFYLNVEQGDAAVQEFAYDDAGVTPQPGGGNDMPALASKPGAGIGFSATTGSYAMKFVLSQTDTVQGVRVYFASQNQSDDTIRISLLQGDPNSCTPGDTLKQDGVQSTFVARRGGGFFNQFWPCFFPRPIVLQAGTYWVSVSQLTPYSFVMGGDLSRGGGTVVIGDPVRPHIHPIYSDPYGTQWSPDHNNGDVSCAFAVETPAGSGEWKSWTPDTTWWATNTNGGASQFYTISPVMNGSFNRAGTYLPMIRVMTSAAPVITRSVAQRSTHVMTLYPNPTPGPLTIEEDEAITEIEVTNILGQTVLRSTAAVTLDLSQLPQGTYFVKIASANSISIHAVVRM